MQKKFAKLISSLNEAITTKDDLGYTKFLTSVLYELDDFDFEK